MRKQSLDVSMLQGNLFRNARGSPMGALPSYPGTPPANRLMNVRRDSIHQMQHTNTPPPIQQQPIASTAQSTFSKVAAAVMGATVGKRRPSVSAATEMEAGATAAAASPQMGGSSLKQNVTEQYQVQEGYGSVRSHIKYGPPLDQEQLGQHSQFMSSEVKKKGSCVGKKQD
jgi:hypothetical protein